jgi:CheY-like chemotaxis protein
MAQPTRLTKGQLYAEMQCLIIDDSKVIRGGLRSLLTGLGLKPGNIIESQNVAHAIQSVDLEPNLDVVFCDISLNDGIGIDILRHSRAQEKRAVLPFIFISSDVSNEHLKQFIELGVKDVLLKPLSAHSVESSLNRQLPILMGRLVAGTKA